MQHHRDLNHLHHRAQEQPLPNKWFLRPLEIPKLRLLWRQNLRRQVAPDLLLEQIQFILINSLSLY